MGSVVIEAQGSRFRRPCVDETAAAAPGHETAVFAGGCFWGMQTVFQRVKGVTATTAGYSGGSAETCDRTLR